MYQWIRGNQFIILTPFGLGRAALPSSPLVHGSRRPGPIGVAWMVVSVNGVAFHRACRGALNCPLIVHSAQRVMLCLLDAANQDAEVYLGQLEIARRLGLSDRAVRTSLRRLTRSEWIEPLYMGRARPGQKRWATRFKIHLDKLIEFDPQPEADFQSCELRDRKSEVAQPEVQGNETGSPASRDRKRTSANRLKTVLLTDSLTEIQAAAPPVGGVHSEKGRAKTVKSNGAALAFEIPASLNVPQFQELWTEWVLERKARGKSLTARAAKMQLTTLEGMGLDGAMASIRQSIEKGWTGLFEARPDGSGVRRDDPSKVRAPEGKYAKFG